jgi:hypothetical protein
MSPAGSGGGQFRRERGTRTVRLASVCTWVLPWLLPVGLLGVVGLLSLSGTLGYVLAGIWGWLAFPYLAAYIRSRSSRGHSGFRADESDYWRTRLR